MVNCFCTYYFNDNYYCYFNLLLGFKPGQANKIFNVKNEPSGIRNQMAINEMYKQQQTTGADNINNKDTLETDASEIKTVNNNNTTQTAKQAVIQPGHFILIDHLNIIINYN